METKPLDVLNSIRGKPIIVRLRGAREFQGILNGYDIHMNLVLDDAKEMLDEETKRIGTIVVRGDNVVYISLLLQDA
ncbi:MAG: LSM domain-containing protein [Methermicoccaceae archaeon]